MVTSSELQKQEEELIKLKQENVNISAEAIPERKYGSKITPQVQKQYVQRREQARANVPIIEENITKVQKAKEEVKAYEQAKAQYDAQIAEQKKRQEEYKQGYNAGLNDRIPWGFKGARLEGFKAGRARLKYAEEKAEYNRQKELQAIQEPTTVEPISQETQRNIDILNQLRQSTETAKAQLEAEEIKEPTTQDVLKQFGQSTSIAKTKAEYIERSAIKRPELGKIELPTSELIEKPIEPIVNKEIITGSQISANIITKNVLEGYEKIKQDYYKLKQFKREIDIEYFYRTKTKAEELKRQGKFNELPSNTALKIYDPYSSYESYEISQAQKEVLIASEHPYLYKLNKAFGLQDGGSLLFALPMLKPIYRTKPLAPKQPPRSKALDFQKLDDQSTLFTQEITIPKRYEYVTTPFRNALGLPPIKRVYTPQVKFIQSTPTPLKYTSEGLLEFPSFVTLQNKAKLTKKELILLNGISELLDTIPKDKQTADLFKRLSQGNKYVSALKPNQDVFQARLTATPYIRFNYPIKLKQPKRLKTNIEINLLDEYNQNLMLNKNKGQSGAIIKVTPNYPKKVDYSDQFKILNWKKLRTESNIMGIQQKVLETDTKAYLAYAFTNKDITLINKAIAKSRGYPITKGFTVVDKTPSNKPINIDDLKIFTSQQKKLQVPQDLILQKQLQESITKLVSKKRVSPVNRPSKTLDLQTLPLSVGGLGGLLSKSLYEGQASYERQEQSISQNKLFKSMESSRNLELPKTAFDNIQLTRTSENLINKPLELPKLSPREIQLPREIQQPKLDLGLKQLQQSKTMLKQMNEPKSPTRTPTKIPTLKTPPRSPNKPTPLIPSLSDKGLMKSLNNLMPAYQAYIKRFGKFLELGKPTSKGLALRKGEKAVLESLGATFAVKPTGGLTKTKDIKYTPSTKLRDYRIKGKEKRLLKDAFIQKRNTRLSNPNEVYEIQRAKKGGFKI